LKGRLAIRRSAAAVEVDAHSGQNQDQDASENEFAFHRSCLTNQCLNKSASAFAITWGRKIEMKTKIAENHSSKELRMLALLLHLFACLAW
jgi:hypothetical protein